MSLIDILDYFHLMVSYITLNVIPLPVESGGNGNLLASFIVHSDQLFMVPKLQILWGSGSSMVKALGRRSGVQATAPPSCHCWYLEQGP